MILQRFSYYKDYKSRINEKERNKKKEKQCLSPMMIHIFIMGNR